MAAIAEKVASLVDMHQVESKLVSRQAGCLKCSEEPLTCPPCQETGQKCFFTVQKCNECPQAICVVDDAKSSKPAPPSSSGSNTGAIAGGVVGGIAVIAVLTYLVWRFFIKTKRQALPQDAFEDESSHKLDAEKAVSGSHRDHRLSTHTVHSIASTVLTRASNIIQIAYIPGVTNRATPTSPTLLVPPVPPIPMAVPSSAANTPSPYEEQHFFVPGGLRDSTYSGLSYDSDRTSFARTSYAPRSSIAPSIASTIYGKNAVVVAPAQTGRLIKPAVVSVKSMGGHSAGSSTPPVPSVDFEKYNRPMSRDSTFSVGSTFLNNASTATAIQSRAQMIRVGSGPKTVTVASSNKSVTPSSSSSSLASPPQSPARTPGPTPLRETLSFSPTIPEESSVADQGPFSDPPESSKSSKHNSGSNLSAVIEEATRLAASGPDRRSKRLSSAGRDSSPFGDEHATKE